eukprot:1137478-Pelagomonas_calceolata.AAC.2
MVCFEWVGFNDHELNKQLKQPQRGCLRLERKALILAYQSLLLSSANPSVSTLDCEARAQRQDKCQLATLASWFLVFVIWGVAPSTRFHKALGG